MKDEFVSAIHMGLWTLCSVMEKEKVKELVVLLGSEGFEEEISSCPFNDFDRQHLLNISEKLSGVELVECFGLIDELVDIISERLFCSEKINSLDLSYADRERANYKLTLDGVREQVVLRSMLGEDCSVYLKSFEKDFKDYSVNYKLVIDSYTDKTTLKEVIKNSQKDALVVLNKYKNIFKGLSLKSLAEMEGVF